MVVGLASPLHNALFQAGHSGPHTPYLVHSARDALLALAVNLPIAALVSAALLNMRPWAAPLVDAWRRPRSSGRRYALRGALGLILIAPVALVAQSSAQLASAGLTPGTPCPPQAAASVKVFDVRAIDVDMPLNRFGDHDPSGHMYVGVAHDASDPNKLQHQVDAVRAEEQSRHVSIGLKATTRSSRSSSGRTWATASRSTSPTSRRRRRRHAHRRARVRRHRSSGRRGRQ